MYISSQNTIITVSLICNIDKNYRRYSKPQYHSVTAYRTTLFRKIYLGHSGVLEENRGSLKCFRLIVLQLLPDGNKSTTIYNSKENKQVNKAPLEHYAVDYQTMARANLRTIFFFLNQLHVLACITDTSFTVRHSKGNQTEILGTNSPGRSIFIQNNTRIRH